MDNTLNRRLVMLREVFAGKRGQRRFAQLVGIKQQSISNYERGSVPSANVLTKIVLVTGVSAEWLLTGRGPMFSDTARKEAKGKKSAEPAWVDENGQAVTAAMLAEILDVSEARAKAFTDSIAQSTVGRERMSVAVRRPDGRIYMLHPPPINPADAASRIAVEVTDTEVHIAIPQSLMRSRAVRISPSRTESG